MCQRVLQIERAVRVNPRNPDLEGPEAYMLHASDNPDIQTPGFDQLIASQQKDAVFLQKQARLAAEEARLKGKRDGPKVGKGEEANAKKK